MQTFFHFSCSQYMKSCTDHMQLYTDHESLNNMTINVVVMGSGQNSDNVVL